MEQDVVEFEVRPKITTALGEELVDDFEISSIAPQKVVIAAARVNRLLMIKLS